MKRLLQLTEACDQLRSYNKLGYHENRSHVFRLWLLNKKSFMLDRVAKHKKLSISHTVACICDK